MKSEFEIGDHVRIKGTNRDGFVDKIYISNQVYIIDMRESDEMEIVFGKYLELIR